MPVNNVFDFRRLFQDQEVRMQNYRIANATIGGDIAGLDSEINSDTYKYALRAERNFVLARTELPRHNEIAAIQTMLWRVGQHAWATGSNQDELGKFGDETKYDVVEFKKAVNQQDRENAARERKQYKPSFPEVDAGYDGPLKPTSITRTFVEQLMVRSIEKDGIVQSPNQEWFTKHVVQGLPLNYQEPKPATPTVSDDEVKRYNQDMVSGNAMEFPKERSAQRIKLTESDETLKRAQMQRALTELGFLKPGAVKYGQVNEASNQAFCDFVKHYNTHPDWKRRLKGAIQNTNLSSLLENPDSFGRANPSDWDAAYTAINAAMEERQAEKAKTKKPGASNGPDLKPADPTVEEGTAAGNGTGTPSTNHEKKPDAPAAGGANVKPIPDQSAAKKAREAAAERTREYFASNGLIPSGAGARAGTGAGAGGASNLLGGNNNLMMMMFMLAAMQNGGSLATAFNPLGTFAQSAPGQQNPILTALGGANVMQNNGTLPGINFGAITQNPIMALLPALFGNAGGIGAGGTNPFQINPAVLTQPTNGGGAGNPFGNIGNPLQLLTGGAGGQGMMGGDIGQIIFFATMFSNPQLMQQFMQGMFNPGVGQQTPGGRLPRTDNVDYAVVPAVLRTNGNQDDANGSANNSGSSGDVNNNNSSSGGTGGDGARNTDENKRVINAVTNSSAGGVVQADPEARVQLGDGKDKPDPQVYRVQMMLAALYPEEHLKPNGVFDENTQKLVTQFNASNNFDITHYNAEKVDEMYRLLDTNNTFDAKWKLKLSELFYHDEDMGSVKKTLQQSEADSIPTPITPGRSVESQPDRRNIT